MINTRTESNQGMTLVELLVSVAVLGIAMIGIVSLMSASSKYFSNSNREVSVQQDLQTTFALVSNMIADANGSVTCSSTADGIQAKIVDKTNEYCIVWKGEKLYACRFSTGAGNFTVSDNNLLADHVISFDLNTDHYDDGYVTLSMAVKYGSREAAMTKNVYMRNAGKEYSNFLSDCEVGTPSVTDNTKISFEITQKTGETIAANTVGVIKAKLAVSASTANDHKGIKLDAANTSVTGADIVGQPYYNPITGYVTIHCKINGSESWEDKEKITCTIALDGGIINASNSFIESISK